jgi:hypothetical protein
MVSAIKNYLFSNPLYDNIGLKPIARMREDCPSLKVTS